MDFSLLLLLILTKQCERAEKKAFNSRGFIPFLSYLTSSFICARFVRAISDSNCCKACKVNKSTVVRNL